MDIHLIKDNELFGIGQPAEAEDLLNQLNDNHIITVGKVMVRSEKKEWLKDEFILRFVDNGETTLEKIAYITSYRAIVTETMTMAEKCTVVTRNPGEQIKRAEASITL